MDEPLRLKIGGQEVEGRFIHRSDTLIDVEIVAPYRGFHASLEMASFSRKRMPRGLHESEGIASGETLLRRLYRLCRYLDRNRVRLRDAYREYSELARTKSSDRIGDGMLVALREHFAKQLEAGEITREEYRRRIAAERVKHSKYHERLYVLQREFFAMHFTFTLTAELQDQVLEYLRRELLSSGDEGTGLRIGEWGSG